MTNCVGLILTALIIPQSILGNSLLFALIYIWSKYDPESQITIYGFLIKAYQFPFILMIFNMLIGGGIVADLMGLAVGHIYYILKETVPVQYGYDLLKTPEFLGYFAKRASGEQRQAFQGRGYRIG